jgi:protein phosphatase
VSTAAELHAESISFQDHSEDSGPFDIVGDVHGCIDELRELLETLGYQVGDDLSITPPDKRRLIFVGDLADRGPGIPEVFRLVSTAIAQGKAFCVAGNHDVRLATALCGKTLPLTYGLADSLEQFGRQSPEFTKQMAIFIKRLPGHLIFDHARLLVAHAGLKESMHRAATIQARELAIHGEKTGVRDQWGEIRYPWAAEYQGNPLIVFGHTPVESPAILNNTINIDTGCVFGGSLTSLRYPECEFVSVPAKRKYYEPTRPFLPDDPRLRIA